MKVSPLDNSQGKRALEEIGGREESLRLFRALIDRTNDAIEVVDPETGHFLDVNERACLVHGYTREEYLALCVTDIEETLDHWPPTGMKDEEFRKSKFMTVGGRHRRKDGSTFPVEVGLNFIQLDRDYLVAVVRDVSERQRAEQALRDSEARLRKITDNMTDLICQLDLKGIYQYANPSFERILGYQPENLLGQSAFALVHPDDLADVLAAVETAVLTRADQRATLRFRHQQGHYLWLESVGKVLDDANGQAHSMVVSSRVISERKQAEEDLRASEAELRQTKEAAEAAKEKSQKTKIKT